MVPSLRWCLKSDTIELLLTNNKFMTEKNSFDGVSFIDPQEEMAVKEAKINELRERLDNLKLNASWNDTRDSNDGVLIRKLEAEIAQLEDELGEPMTMAEGFLFNEDSQEKVETDFNALFAELEAKGGVQGTSRKYSAEDLIERIKEVRRINRDTRGDLDLINVITSADDLRNRVTALIRRERGISRSQK